MNFVFAITRIQWRGSAGNWAKATDPVSVELDFELGGNRYRVIRGLTMAELFLNDDEGATSTELELRRNVLAPCQRPPCQWPPCCAILRRR